MDEAGPSTDHIIEVQGRPIPIVALVVANFTAGGNATYSASYINAGVFWGRSSFPHGPTRLDHRRYHHTLSHHPEAGLPKRQGNRGFRNGAHRIGGVHLFWVSRKTDQGRRGRKKSEQQGQGLPPRKIIEGAPRPVIRLMQRRDLLEKASRCEPHGRIIHERRAVSTRVNSVRNKRPGYPGPRCRRGGYSDRRGGNALDTASASKLLDRKKGNRRQPRFRLRRAVLIS